MFAAFLATLPIYSPNQLLFETELLQRAAYMPAFANTLLGASVVLGVAVAIVSARGRLAVILRGGVVLAASVAYVAGYALFALAAGLESFAQPIFGVTAGLLLAVSTVVLSVAWGPILRSSTCARRFCGWRLWWAWRRWWSCCSHRSPSPWGLSCSRCSFRFRAWCPAGWHDAGV